MAKNKKQAVEPNVSRTKFENELAEFLLIENDWRKKGVICVKAEFPIFEFIFIAHNVKPPTVAFAVSIDFTNYDVEPPSIVFIDSFTGKPIEIKDMSNIGFFQVTNQEIQIPGIQLPGMPNGLQQIQQRNPILMIGLNDRPFLCIPGVREYHNHPAHTDNPWLNYRTLGEGRLLFLLDQLYNHSIPYFTGFNMSVQFHLKQF